MVSDLWINLPVKDVRRSRGFFTNLGFTFAQHGNTDQSACLELGKKKMVVMLFNEPMFRKCTGNEPSDAHKGSEVLLSIGAESKEQVDEMVKSWTREGGKVFGQPSAIDGWMYGCGLIDLDGHRWNMLYMDMSKMPQ
jgi:predicted lactoylglutathione lyase